MVRRTNSDLQSRKLYFQNPWWTATRIAQWALMWVCLGLTISAAGRTVERAQLFDGVWIPDLNVPPVQYRDLSHGWTYSLMITMVSIHTSMASWYFICRGCGHLLRPPYAFAIDLLSISQFSIAMIANVFAQESIRKLDSDPSYIITNAFALKAHYVMTGILAFCILASITTTTFISWPALKDFRKRTCRSKSTPLPAPATAPTASSGVTAQNSPPTTGSEQTRAEVLRERVEAATTPPSYFYATVRASREGRESQTENDLPRYTNA